MVKLLRVDHRLMHGQVVFSWVKYTESNCILIANDDVVNDEIRKSVLKFSKPKDCKLVIKNIDDSIAALNSGVTDKYNLIILVDNIKDACKLIKETNINSINLGGTKATDKTKSISKAVNITQEEEKLLDELVSNVVEVEIRQIANDSKVLYKVYK